jgi:NADH-quinone oxidoreductase subunit A
MNGLQNNEIRNIIEYLSIIILISILILIMSYITTNKDKKKEREKSSIYECGFDPFSDSRIKFEVKYYIIGILFILFDIEILYMIPWSIVIVDIGYFGFLIMYLFLIILSIGYFYEWREGILEWKVRV